VRYPCTDGTRIFIYFSPDHAGKSPATLAGGFVEDLDQTMDELALRGVRSMDQCDSAGVTSGDVVPRR
jgi:hypothetical protein